MATSTPFPNRSHRESMTDRGKQTHRQDLTPLLHARSVAIVGISQLPRFGGWVYKNLHDFGYQGKIFGVNPRYTTLYDQPCYASLRDLPERPDCAVLAIPNERLLAALDEAAELSISAAVIFSSAHSDPAPSGGQPSLQDKLAEVARANGMAICGPNCMGFHAFGQKLVVSGYPVTPGTASGGVAFITHSGSVFDAFWQNTRGVRFNYVISSGNEIVTTMADYMQFALDDPTTRVVALFLETIRDPATFVAALSEA
ncbi:MAG: CoA-binding protein, partial [Chloroflexi bacterium]|nr:CoA-binding protein [Chloroflexota bacterium]